MKRSGPSKRRTRKPPEPQWDEFLTEAEIAERELNKIRESALADTGLSIRTVNTLEEHGILTVGALADKAREDLLGIDNLGEQTLEACDQMLNEINIPHPEWKKSSNRKS
jgi:DNA-directed RNA polymerase alpha subunit